MKWISLLCLCFVLPVSAAGLARKPAPIHPIPYNRVMPRAASVRMSKGDRSFFWGTFQTNPKEVVYGVHFYKKAKEIEHEKQYVYGYGVEYALDIFRAKTISTKLQLIQSELINIKKGTSAATLAAAQWVWIDPAKQKTLVLRFDVWTPDGVYGRFGDSVFIGFPKGLSAQGSILTLMDGSWRASDISGQSSRFIVGENGLTEIFIAQSPATSELTEEEMQRDYQFTLRWDGAEGKFVDKRITAPSADHSYL